MRSTLYLPRLTVVNCMWLVVLVHFPPTISIAQEMVELEKGVFHESERCGECHQEIYQMWRKSLHSAALTDPVFDASYTRAYRETQGEARNVCLRCHAPVAVHLEDFDLTEPISREGITCDYCHSVVSVDLDNHREPLKVALDGVKRGPLLDAESPVHAVEKSPLHQQSEFCAGCHQYVNDHGMAVLSTYTEWKSSPQAAEGKSCQTCHMPLTPGETVVAPLGSGRTRINLHNISGGHSTEQVKKAARVKVVSVRRRGENVDVDVEVANIGSGHSIPTGMPTRKLVLEVLLYASDQVVRRFERRFERSLLDEKGYLIRSDHDAILRAARLANDTRLRPGETRRERFSSVVTPRGSLRAEAILRYVYEPEILVPQRMSIEMASDEQRERPE